MSRQCLNAFFFSRLPWATVARLPDARALRPAAAGLPALPDPAVLRGGGHRGDAGAGEAAAGDLAAAETQGGLIGHARRQKREEWPAFVLSDPVGRLRAEAEKEEAEENYGELVLALWDFALTLFLAP